MTEMKTNVDKAVHRQLGVDLFNLTWDFIEKAERTETEDNTMLNAAHASRFHWEIAGTPLNVARGEWQISRVYSLLQRPEPAIYHAQNSLSICLEHSLGDFDTGFAYEALARAFAVQGNLKERDRHLELAIQSAAKVSKTDDKNWLLKNISTVNSLTLPRWE